MNKHVGVEYSKGREMEEQLAQLLCTLEGKDWEGMGENYSLQGGMESRRKYRHRAGRVLTLLKEAGFKKAEPPEEGGRMGNKNGVCKKCGKAIRLFNIDDAKVTVCSECWLKSEQKGVNMTDNTKESCDVTTEEEI